MKLYYYVSLASSGHKKLKCAGHGAENPLHRQFYLPYFKKFGHGATDQQESQGPFTVVLSPHQGNLIDAPRFQHDCESCLYLGQYKEYDLYYCGEQMIGPRCTVIARWSSDGPDYQSGWAFGKDGQIPELHEAYKRSMAFLGDEAPCT